MRHHHIHEAAGAEGCDREADGGEAQAEALVQVGADEGEGAPEHATLQRHHDDDDEGPSPAQHADHLAHHRALRALARSGEVRADAHDRDQGAAGRQIDGGQHPEDRAPAQPVADRAAQRRARHQPQRLAGEEARQHGLAPVVAHIVADPGDGEWNDGGTRGAGEEARQGEQAERGRERAQNAAEGGADAGDRHYRHLAVAVAERAVHQDEHAVGEQEGRGHDRGAADGDAEFGGELDQKRVGHAHVGGRGEGRDRQEHDGEGGRGLGRGRGGGPRRGGGGRHRQRA